MLFRKPEIIPTLFFLCAFGVLFTLGVWQLERLAWKENIIARVDEVQTLPTLGTLPPAPGKELLYRKVLLTGSFDYEHTMHLIGRQEGFRMGYHMLTPFRLEDDGRVILVNRGFSPLGEESQPQGLVTVEGILRAPREKRYFAPENVPEKNIWSHEDISRIENIIGADLLPLIVEATGAYEPGTFPIPSEGKVIFRNDHLGYAVTWFGLALVSVVMFGAYYRRKPNN